MKNEKKKSKKAVFTVIMSVILLLAAVCSVFVHFGGFGTGDCADTAELAKYAGQVKDISVPEGTRIIALGEATHGNREFQRLKLDVFRHAVEKYGVRALALEADFGGCEAVNRYIHGGEGTAREAAADLIFRIYQTEEMEALIEWMREYNETAPEGKDLRFYGFDMQSYDYSYKYLLEACNAYGIDAAELEKLWEDGGLSDEYSRDQRREIYSVIRVRLAKKEIQEGPGTHDEDIIKAQRFADVLIQNNELGKHQNDPAVGMGMRDRYMADNALWILGQEEERGNGMLFITGHIGHMRQSGCYNADQKFMGALLSDEIGADAYFAIGTDFYKTTCNLPKSSGKRVERTFYSYDPIAKAAYKNGYEECWLDFSAVPEDSPLSQQTNGYIFLGDLGDNYNLLIRILPYAYREYVKPSDLYDGMIFVSEARPIQILSREQGRSSEW